MEMKISPSNKDAEHATLGAVIIEGVEASKRLYSYYDELITL